MAMSPHIAKRWAKISSGQVSVSLSVVRRWLPFMAHFMITDWEGYGDDSHDHTEHDDASGMRRGMQ